MYHRQIPNQNHINYLKNFITATKKLSQPTADKGKVTAAINKTDYRNEVKNYVKWFFWGGFKPNIR